MDGDVRRWCRKHGLQLLRSAEGKSVVEADDTLRRRVVSMYHCFGGKVEEDADFRQLGSNVGRLTPNDRDYDPISGIPRMSNIAVSISPGWS